MTTIKTIKKILKYLQKQEFPQARSNISRAIHSRYISVKRAVHFLESFEILESIKVNDRDYFQVKDTWKGRMEFIRHDNQLGFIITE